MFQKLQNQRIRQIGFIVSILLIISKYCLVEAVRIGIKHWNDVNGQVESFQRGVLGNGAPAPCYNRANAVFQCIGGLRSLAHWLNDTSVFGDEVLPENIFRLSSGNLIGGESGWISNINGGWGKYGELVKKHFRPHVMALGIKEFEAGLQSTIEYINNLDPNTVTLSNTCFRNQSRRYKKDEVEFYPVEYVHFKVGVVGFVNPNVERISLPGKLKFNAIVPSIREVVSRIGNNISTFIAIGDGSIDVAKEIIARIPQVKLVIYGNGYVTNKDDPKMKRSSFNINMVILQNLIPVPGKSRLVETSRPEIWNAAAQSAQRDYTKMEARVRKLKDNIIGQSWVDLQGGNVCWRKECNLGNLVADSMVHCALNKLSTRKTNFHVHALWHAGAPVEHEVKSGTKISSFDIQKWFPYHNQVHLVRTSGKDFRRIFETSATAIHHLNSNPPEFGQFLQISSGMQVYYDSSDGIPKVTRIRMTHDVNDIPKLGDIIDYKYYYLVIPKYLYEGRGIYQFASERGFWTDVTFENSNKSNFVFDTNCMEDYIKALGQVTIGFEKRIWLNGDQNERQSCGEGGSYVAMAMKTVIFSVLIFALLQAIACISYLYLSPLIRRYFSTIKMKYPRNQLEEFE